MLSVCGIQSGGTTGRRYPSDPSVFALDGASFESLAADVVFPDPALDAPSLEFRIVSQQAQVADVGSVLLVEMTRQSDGAPLDLSAASSLQIILGLPDGTKFTKTALLLTNGLDGKIYYVAQAGDLPESGIYSIQGKVAIGAATLYGSVQSFSVLDNITASGGGPTPAPHVGTFVNGDLSGGVLTINHYEGLDAPFAIDVVIFNENGHQIVPDSVVGSENSVAIDLNSFSPLSGTWGWVYT